MKLTVYTLGQQLCIFKKKTVAVVFFIIYQIRPNKPPKPRSYYIKVVYAANQYVLFVISVFLELEQFLENDLVNRFKMLETKLLFVRLLGAPIEPRITDIENKRFLILAHDYIKDCTVRLFELGFNIK